MNGNKHFAFRAITIIFLIIVSGCQNKQKPKSSREEVPGTTMNYTKAASSSGATMVVDKNSVLFFHPDSVQLASFKAATNEQIYESLNHDCFFQMRNARTVLKQYWPGLKVKEVYNTRYVLFVKQDSSVVRFDLDSLDFCGMILFDCIQDPKVADMTNVDTELGFYFSKQ